MNVALATAAGGEDDLTHDKLSHLRTVGSGFGPLIYNFPENACYADLTERWDSLWEALRNNQGLPGKLVRTPYELNFSMLYHLHAVILQSETDLTFCRYTATNSWSGTSQSRRPMVQLRSPPLGR